MSDVLIPSGMALLGGSLELPPEATGIVVFAHGSGSSRFSERNRAVARALTTAGFGTLLFDLLTAEEDEHERIGGRQRFNIPLLASRLADATRWVFDHTDRPNWQIGYFGASTGAAAALVAAAMPDARVRAVVSRGGRPDLAGEALSRVTAPTLLIVGELDREVLALNLDAYGRLSAEKALCIVPGATHLFEEPGTLERVSEEAVAWFRTHLDHGTRA